MKQQEGIELNASKMVGNAGLKAVSKLMLNSFWGKFGMRDNLNQTEFVFNQRRFSDIA